ncbi:unnamed protein product [Cylicocyclus nassatus]|uniref:Uncharacterized protein n=1 Tax=Cylicocyclus nassatus TaxID=53992 RepID=A0AA36H3M7_CYLNA|nr:unnamed protein product [Cylicocyclus nassatus]
MVVERCVATVLVNVYERRFQSLGILVAVIALFISLVETCGGYKDVVGNQLMTNSFIHPGCKQTSAAIEDF